MLKTKTLFRKKTYLVNLENKKISTNQKLSNCNLHLNKHYKKKYIKLRVKQEKESFKQKQKRRILNTDFNKCNRAMKLGKKKTNKT